MDDSELLELIKLIYPGSTTANHILNGGCFDKTICAHLIDAAICQYRRVHVRRGFPLFPEPPLRRKLIIHTLI